MRALQADAQYGNIMLNAADYDTQRERPLDRVLAEGFERVWTTAQERKVSLRTAAYILGIGRVSRATILGGIR